MNWNTVEFRIVGYYPGLLKIFYDVDTLSDMALLSQNDIFDGQIGNEIIEYRVKDKVFITDFSVLTFYIKRTDGL
jgi:hypothetical protein